MSSLNIPCRKASGSHPGARVVNGEGKPPEHALQQGDLQTSLLPAVVWEGHRTASSLFLIDSPEYCEELKPRTQQVGQRMKIWSCSFLARANYGRWVAQHALSLLVSLVLELQLGLKPNPCLHLSTISASLLMLLEMDVETHVPAALQGSLEINHWQQTPSLFHMIQGSGD